MGKQPSCPICESQNVIRNGRRYGWLQQYRCKTCGASYSDHDLLGPPDLSHHPQLRHPLLFCIHCHSSKIRKYGKYKGRQRYQCLNCLAEVSGKGTFSHRSTSRHNYYLAVLFFGLLKVNYSDSARILDLPTSTIHRWSLKAEKEKERLAKILDIPESRFSKDQSRIKRLPKNVVKRMKEYIWVLQGSYSEKSFKVKENLKTNQTPPELFIKEMFQHIIFQISPSLKHYFRDEDLKFEQMTDSQEIYWNLLTRGIEDIEDEE